LRDYFKTPMKIYFFLMVLVIATYMYMYWLGLIHLVGWKREILIKE
jgi:hypothetical protein